MGHEELIASLQRGAEEMNSGRLRRLLSRPIKIVYPYLLGFLGAARPALVDTFFGRRMKVLLPEAISVRIWRYGVFEEDVAFYMCSTLRPGDTFIDVGSHFGFFSMLARELVGADGKVVSFEPMPKQRAFLEENMQQHSAPSKHYLVAAAAGANTGQVTFKDFGLMGSAFATFKEGRDLRFEVLGEVKVDLRTVDSVVEELRLTNVQLIKIDAENAEYEVVQGTIETIRNLRPAVILEAGDSDNEESSTRRVVDRLLIEDYLPFEFRDWAIHQHFVTESYVYQNLLMVPREKMGDMINVGSVSRQQ